MESVTKPEGYPYFTFKELTEREDYNKELEHTIAKYDPQRCVIDFEQITPIAWKKFKVKFPDDTEYLCVQFEYTTNIATEVVYVDETLKSFGVRLRTWIEYKKHIELNNGTQE